MKLKFFAGAFLATAVLTSMSAVAATSELLPASSATHVVKPVPLEIVSPTNLPPRFKGATVKLTFTIDEAGNPHDVAAVGAMPPDLAKRLLPVVAQWKFAPMYENGRPVSVRVVFPLELAEKA